MNDYETRDRSQYKSPLGWVFRLYSKILQGIRFDINGFLHCQGANHILEDIVYF